MEIIRHYEGLLSVKLKPNKVLVLLGARHVGKTQLLKKFSNDISEKVLFLK